MFVLFVMQSYLTKVRGLKHGMAQKTVIRNLVVPYKGTWVETVIYKPIFA